MSVIEIDRGLSIPESEVWFTASRSSGPGGQHVQKVSSRMTLHFDVRDSASLTDERKRRIASRLPTRINKEGVLKLHSQSHRSQAANRAELVERFAHLIREALRERRPRRRTRPSAASAERRLDRKKRRGHVKKARSGRIVPEG